MQKQIMGMSTARHRTDRHKPAPAAAGVADEFYGDKLYSKGRFLGAF